MLKAKVEKIQMPIFSIALLCLQYYMQVKNALQQRRKNRNWFRHRGPWKDPCWEHCCMNTSKVNNLESQWSDGCKCRGLKVEILLGQTKGDSLSYQVISKNRKWPHGRPPWQCKNEICNSGQFGEEGWDLEWNWSMLLAKDVENRQPER